MLSLVIHAALGALTVALCYRFNGHLYRRDWPGADVTPLEGIYYAFAVVSAAAGLRIEAGKIREARLALGAEDDHALAARVRNERRKLEVGRRARDGLRVFGVGVLRAADRAQSLQEFKRYVRELRDRRQAERDAEDRRRAQDTVRAVP